MNKEVANHQLGIKKNPLLHFLPLILCLLTLLTGCVDYDVGVNFESPYKGTIVQHIQVGEQLVNLAQPETKQWLNSLEERAYQLRGKVKRISSQEIAVTIPFTNGQELAKNFNQFFDNNSDPISPSKKDVQDSENLASKMSLQQSNLLLVERNHLNLTVDLTSLGAIANRGKIVVTPDSLLDLTFELNAPWIAYSLKGSNILTPAKNTQEKLIWHLQPGRINHIEAVVWLPSPLGIGTAIIIALMIAGFYLKYGHFPGTSPATAKSV